MNSMNGFSVSAEAGSIHIKNIKRAVAAASFASLAWMSAGAFAATPGDLDGSFAGSGFVTEAQGDLATGSAVVSDYKNRVVTAFYAINNAPGSYNEYSVMRHLDTGALDTSFGASGIVNLPLPSKDLLCIPELVEDSSTNLLVASCNADTIFVWRLKNSGAIDTSYGIGGLASIPVGAGVYPVIGMTQYKNRAMIATSSIAPGTTRPRFTLVRLTASGVLDTSLAGSGIARYDILPGTVSEIGRAVDVKLDAANRIVLGGRVRAATMSDYQFALARVSFAGVLDTTFGVGGATHFPILTGPNFGRRLAFDPKSRILLSGTTCYPADPVTGEQKCYVGLARLLNNGALDTSLVGGTGTNVYGGGGGPANPKKGFCTDYTYNYGLTTYKDRIYLVGSCDLSPFSTKPTYPGSITAYTLRLDANGQYDTSFGYTMNGFTYYDFGAPEAVYLGVAIDKNAQILATGGRRKTVSDTEVYGEVVTSRAVQ
ncbi:MAG: hypothetical protein ABL931_10375 [Usitatibacteraceae bacterium]